MYEWWPEHGQGPLWLRTGRGWVPVEITSLNLPETLADAVESWNGSYEEAKIPVDGSDGDAEWLSLGIELLADTRTALRGRATVIVTEPWWGEKPADY